MKIASIYAGLLALALTAVAGASTALAGKCPSNLQYCEPGSYGSGGCYKIGYARCTKGLICSTDMVACPPGKLGKGGCYKIGYAFCRNGAICSTGMELCVKNGRAYCYKPGYASCQ